MNIDLILSYITWIDVLIVILLIKISYEGLNSGFSSGLIPTLGIFAAIVVSLNFYTVLGNFIVSYSVLSNAYANLISIVIVTFFIRFLVFKIAQMVLRSVIKLAMPAFINKAGGLLLGIVRAGLYISLLLIILSKIPFSYFQVLIMDKSLMAKSFLGIGYSIQKATAALL